MGQNRAENFSKPTPFFPPKCYDFHTKNRRKTALLSHFQRKTAFSRFTVALFSFYMKDHSHIAHNDVFFGGEGRIGGREENQFPAGQPFPKIIVAVAA